MPFSEGYLHSPEYQRWVAMQQYAMEPQPLLTPGATIAKMLQGGVAAYGAKKSQAQYDAKQSEKASLLASLLQKEPVSDVAVTPALSNPETSGADLQQRQQMGAYNQPTSQAPDTSQMLAKLLAGGKSDAGSELVNQIAPMLMQQQFANEAQANQPITPYQRAQLGLEQRRSDPGYLGQVAQAQRPTPEYAGEVATATSQGQLPAELDKQKAAQTFTAGQNELTRENAQTVAGIRAGSTGSNVQSVQPLGNGQLLKVFRDGRTEVTMMDGTPVMGARNDPTALFNQSAATASGKGAGTAAEAFPVVQANYDIIKKSLDAFNDPAIKKEAPYAIGFGSMAPTVPGYNSNFRSMRDQLKGQAFLQAFNALKGGGQITEVEGAKATDAIARLNSANTPTEFYKALDDARGTFSTLFDAAKQRAQRGATVPQMGGGAPQAQPQAAPQQQTVPSQADIDAELRRRGALPR